MEPDQAGASMDEARVKAFNLKQKVRFQHCDPAGMVFYPRYYDMLNAAVEDYFEDVVGISHALLCDNNMGIPMVHISLDFKRPSFLGDTLEFSLCPLKIGRSSLRLQVVIASENGETRVTGEAVLVFTNLKTLRPEAIPRVVIDALTTTHPSPPLYPGGA